MEYLAKPAVMILLLFWLWTEVGLGGALNWFTLGILFSLLGDVLLMISLDRLLLAGLVTFLFANIAYIIGFNIPLPGMSFFGIVFAVMIGIGGRESLAAFWTVCLLVDKGRCAPRSSSTAP